MKATVKRVIKDETGKLLILTLILLVIGGLVLGPLLGLMSTGLIAGQVYEKNTAELYAADAGIEKAIWHLQKGGSPKDVLEFTLNGKEVTVTITEFPRACHEMATFEIISTALGEGDSFTRVTAHVTNITVFYEGDKSLSAGEYIGGHVYVEHTLELNADASIAGDVMAGEDVIMNAGSLIGGVVCVGGNLELNNEASIEADVYVQGYVKLTGTSHLRGDVYARQYVAVDGQGPSIEGDVYTPGTVIVRGKDSAIQGNVYCGGSVTLDGQNARIEQKLCTTGTISIGGPNAYIGEVCTCGSCADYVNWYCPLGGTTPEILIWLIV